MLKRYFFPLSLVFLAICFFAASFFSHGIWKEIMSIVSFGLSIAVAVAEIVRSRREEIKMEKELKKRPETVFLTEDEYEEKKNNGTLDNDTLYMTYEE